jgi:hypothetical protein
MLRRESAPPSILCHTRRASSIIWARTSGGKANPCVIRQPALWEPFPVVPWPKADSLYQALSDFAEYVEQQQSLRFPATSTATAAPATGATSSKAAAANSTAAAAAAPAPAPEHHHEELDELFDNLDLADSAPRISLRELVLGTDDDTLQKLQDVLAQRIAEGFGEAVFELGYENNGDSMKLSLEEWDVAYKRLVEAAKRIRADCDLLLTKNVGGDKEEAASTGKPGKERACSAKVLIRQSPAKMEDIIETRIAVVGNGKLNHLAHVTEPLAGTDVERQWTLAKVPC